MVPRAKGNAREKCFRRERDQETFRELRTRFIFQACPVIENIGLQPFSNTGACNSRLKSQIRVKSQAYPKPGENEIPSLVDFLKSVSEGRMNILVDKIIVSQRCPHPNHWKWYVTCKGELKLLMC
jgi:hypothetical protein